MINVGLAPTIIITLYRLIPNPFTWRMIPSSLNPKTYQQNNNADKDDDNNRDNNRRHYCLPYRCVQTEITVN